MKFRFERTIPESTQETLWGGFGHGIFYFTIGDRQEGIKIHFN